MLHPALSQFKLLLNTLGTKFFADSIIKMISFIKIKNYRTYRDITFHYRTALALILYLDTESVDKLSPRNLIFYSFRIQIIYSASNILQYIAVCNDNYIDILNHLYYIVLW